MLFQFGDNKTLKIPSHIAGVRVLGVWWVWGFVVLGCFVLLGIFGGRGGSTGRKK